MKKLLVTFAILILGSLVVAQEAPAANAPEANAPAAAEKASADDAAWQAALKAIDKDGDGKCTPAECNDFVEKTEATLAELRQQNMLARIMRLDQNQDNAISKDELPESNDQVSMLFNRLDVNKDGKLDQDEMKAIFTVAGNRQRGERRPRAQGGERRGPEARERRGPGQEGRERREGQPGAGAGAGLARFDKNQDGVVTRDELPDDRPNVTAMFDRLDTNKDGKLDQDEMKAGRVAGNRGERRRNQAAEPAGIKAD